MENDKFNKILKEKYFLLKDIAKKYDYSEELLDMITFIYISFYMDFGKKCDYPLYDLFNKVKIIYDRGTVNDISIKNGFGEVPSGASAVTIFTPNLKVFENASLKQKPQTIILGTHVGDYLATETLKLEMLAHEIRHALMGYYNTNTLIDENTYYMRSGLGETYYIKDDSLKDKYKVKENGRTIDEITNTYITELLINRIMNLKKYKIENSTLNRYLSRVKTSQKDGRYRAIGYFNEIKLWYPILLNEQFINIVNQHQFDGEIDIIKDFFESNTNLCNYDELSSLTDTIFDGNRKYDRAVENNNVDFIQNHIANIKREKEIILDLKKNMDVKSLVKK